MTLPAPPKRDRPPIPPADPVASNIEQDENPVRNYTILCLAALLVMVMVQVRWGFGLMSTFPFVVGCLGVLLRWKHTPLMVLFVIAGFLVSPMSDITLRGFDLREWVLAGSMLAFVVAHYRLQALSSELLPPERWQRRWSKFNDPKVKQFQEKLTEQRKRPASLVSQMELVYFVITLPLFVLLAHVAYRMLPHSNVLRFGLVSGAWTGVVLMWTVALVLLTTAGLLQYLRYRRMRLDEARMILNDTLWQESRREQRSVARWLTWNWLRRRARRKTV